MIPVTKPYFPLIKEVENHLKEIWDAGIITNNGPKLIELENVLKKRLEIQNISIVTNGTVALQIAIKALDLKGDILTTPFTYVATSSSIVWEGCNPIFVDIDPETLNIDPTKLEENITPNTTAIIATHVFGNPCDIDAINLIAKKYQLSVIYDGAHAFGVKYKGKSVFSYGDITTCSTHATKLFHTVEGGFLSCNNKDVFYKINQMRNFGHVSPYEFDVVGINGKMSELHASIGLINLKHLDSNIEKRKTISKLYDQLLKNVGLDFQQINSSCNKNYSYYPVIFKSEKDLLECQRHLLKFEIHGRRYFYPSLSSALPYVNKKRVDNCEKYSKRVFCLPFYSDLTNDDVVFICNAIKSWSLIKQ